MSEVGAHAVAVVVVIPAYNAEQYLITSVSSVLAQTFTDFQLVIVDDGSTDNTLAVAHSLKVERMVVVSVSNGGPARARNIGVMAAKSSRYLAFLDADDCWHPAKLEQQIRFMEANPSLLAAGCFMQYISASGEPVGRTGKEIKAEEIRLVAQGKLFPFPTSSLLVRREAFEQAAGFDVVFRRAGAEDLDFLSRVAQQGPIACFPEVLGSYRIHGKSAMARNRIRIARETRFVQLRIKRRDEGGELTWDQFQKMYEPSWNDRRREIRTMLFRSAGLWYLEKKWIRVFMYGLVAFILSPIYVTGRIVRLQKTSWHP